MILTGAVVEYRQQAKSTQETFITALSVAEDATAMSRSRSSASDIFVQPDMKILQACWNIILCFMGDDNAALTKVGVIRRFEIYKYFGIFAL